MGGTVSSFLFLFWENLKWFLPWKFHRNCQQKHLGRSKTMKFSLSTPFFFFNSVGSNRKHFYCHSVLRIFIFQLFLLWSVRFLEECFLNFQKVVFLFIFLLLISKLHCGWRMSFFGTDSLKFRFAVAWYMINFCVFEKNLYSLCVWEESVFFNCQVWWSIFFIIHIIYIFVDYFFVYYQLLREMFWNS